MDEETFRPTGTMTDDDLDEIEMAHRARMRAEAELEEAQDALVEHQSWAEELAAVASEDETLGDALARCIDALNEVQHYRDEAELAAELDAARLELRRLRAAEAPGTDDEAFEGTGWRALDGARWVWMEGADSVALHRGARGWEAWRGGACVAGGPLAYDTMRAAVSGGEHG